MTAEALPTQGADERIPPRDTGVNAGNTASVTTSAANIDLNASWGSVSNRFIRGGAWITLQARGGDVYVRFKSTATAAATTSGAASNGEKIADGTKEDFWITPDRPIIDAIGSAACSLFYWQSSPNYGNRT